MSGGTLESRGEDPVDFGYLTRTVRSPWFSCRLPVRIVGVSLILFGISLAFGAAAMRYGDYPLTLNDVLLTVTGRGREFHERIVLQWRLPIIVAAIAFGAILGIGGAIFQSLTRNPLGSPDVIGFDAGSYTAVVVLILVVGTRDYWSLASAAILGGILTAFVVYLLSYRRGVQGFRLIIVGIGVSAMLGSINAYLITRASLEDALSVGFWGAGSLARVTWGSMVPALAVISVIVAASAFLAPSLRRIELGDDAALTLGTRVGRASSSSESRRSLSSRPQQVPSVSSPWSHRNWRGASPVRRGSASSPPRRWERRCSRQRSSSPSSSPLTTDRCPSDSSPSASAARI